MKFAETKRLIIRHLQSDDLDMFYEICGNSEIMRYVGNGLPLSKEQSRLWIEKSQDNYQKLGFGCSAVITKKENQLVGYCGLVESNNTEEQEAEIIYAFRKEFWGKGFGIEAARAMLEFGLNQCGLKRILATIDPENFGSIKIAKKLGMQCRERRLDEYNLPEVLYTIENLLD